MILEALILESIPTSISETAAATVAAAAPSGDPSNFMPASMVALVIFIAMILNLASKPKQSKKLYGIFVVISGVFAVVAYGYGYANSEQSFAVVMVRTLLAVCGIYVGKVDFSVVKDTWFFQQEIGKLVFWLVHLMALYATTSAAITTLGAEAMQQLRLFLARWGELNLIYGVNADSVEFGKSLMAEGKCTVVFIDSQADASLASSINKAKCVLRQDDNAVNADRKFLRSIGMGPGNRKMNLYALSKDAGENLRYATHMLQTLQWEEISPEQTNLVMLGREDGAAASLQVLGERYGYGYVTVYQETTLVSRLLIRNSPPWECISFDQDARAKEDFEVLQVGFGQLGQNMLRHLVRNGQFAGSRFRAAVFAPDCESQIGYFANQYSQMLRQYDIEFYPFDARSRNMYEYIRSRGQKIKYVVLCTGSEKMNREVAEELREFFELLDIHLPIHQCSYSGITIESAGETKRFKLYRKQVLATRNLDTMAMELNHYYCNDDSKTALEHWMVCDYFSRMSSRATADFAGAVIRAAGRTPEKILDGDCSLSEEQLENLSITEHERWCAFHYSMGFSTMSQEEYDRRAGVYQKQKQEGKPTIRIGKDLKKRIHACLIPWDQLDELSQKESKITGKTVNYQNMDRENVLAIPKLLILTREDKK